jgi:hypothetical protein
MRPSRITECPIKAQVGNPATFEPIHFPPKSQTNARKEAATR